jgi:hypothetical protein
MHTHTYTCIHTCTHTYTQFELNHSSLRGSSCKIDNITGLERCSINSNTSTSRNLPIGGCLGSYFPQNCSRDQNPAKYFTGESGMWLCMHVCVCMDKKHRLFDYPYIHTEQRSAKIVGRQGEVDAANACIHTYERSYNKHGIFNHRNEDWDNILIKYIHTYIHTYTRSYNKHDIFNHRNEDWDNILERNAGGSTFVCGAECDDQ